MPVKCSKCNNFSKDDSQTCRFCGAPIYNGIPIQNLRPENDNIPQNQQANVVLNNFKNIQANNAQRNSSSFNNNMNSFRNNRFPNN